MIAKRLFVCMLLAISVTMGAQAVEYARGRYDPIVERSPFGEETVVDPDAAQDAKEAAAAAAAAQRMEKEIRLCYLLETESGEVRAGFQDLKAQKGDPRSFMLAMGESYTKNGMKLSKIDLANSSATLIINGKSVTFELAKAPVAAASATTAQAPAQPQRRFGGGFRQTQPPAQPAKPPEPELSPEEQEKRREEVRENLRQYQMEVIRAGMPPLPIPLTQEMDDQLVAEGVLPPADEEQ